MRSIKQNKRVDGSPGKKWSQRFPKKRNSGDTSTFDAADANHDRNSFQQEQMEQAVQPQGPLQSQLNAPSGSLHSQSEACLKNVVEDTNSSVGESTRSSVSSYAPPQIIPNWTSIDSQNQGIELDDCIPSNPSSSSNHAVMAIDCSVSPTNSAPGEPVHRPQQTGPSSPQSPASTPSASSWHNNNKELRKRDNSAAIETRKDKIDDDAYSAWWFLASISESFDTLQSTIGGGRKTPTPEKQQQRHLEMSGHTKESEGSGTQLEKVEEAVQSVSEDATHASADVGSSNGNLAMYEMPSLQKSSESSSSSAMRPTKDKPYQSPYHHQLTKPLAGGEYTQKEQRIRQQSLQALGGKLNFDRQGDVMHDETMTYSSGSHASNSPYHYVPNHQHVSMMKIQPNHSTGATTSSNPDWDMKYVRSKRSGDVDWTPQDSSYGAAVQAFGWVPKRIRKLLEGVFVVLIITFLIFIVVKAGIKLKSSGSSSSGGEDIYFEDDDHYLANNDGNDSQNSDSNDGGSESNDESGNDHLRRLVRYR